MKTNANAKPVFEVRLNQIRVTVWKNESDKGTWFNTSMIRRYRDEQGEWQDSHAFSGLGDLALIAEGVRQARSFIERQVAGSTSDELDEVDF